MTTQETSDTLMQRIPVAFEVNGERVEKTVEPHLMLLDLLRDELGLPGQGAVGPQRR